ncbi:respiratory nitrate reductase gamma subunit [Raineyella antarctica]|uniref:Nitrate reductase-like protein NarX n=1 Tax=Raineyella antarctica TaxID=1577474 RepID=A0A1G6HWZ3_9ACTN|nr:respiratory nitrate reductase subunit gamma [Raineyella antarctica]SDB98772.1 respiratory nitrate reductase gamma subunit [Raineyella antarctica]
MTALEIMLWIVFPYVSLTMLVVGTIWRYRHDKFGWTTRSSELHESRMLRLGSPLFHYGILAVGAGHVMGLLVPKTWTEGMGIKQEAYHLLATVGGGLAGLATVLGLALLIYRRRTVGGVFQATTVNDKVMYVLLALPILLGSIATVMYQVLGGEGYDYRATISPWLRSILGLQPQADLMTGVPLYFQLHIVAAFLLFAIWPYTRLVHAFSVPLAYPTRPYIVYRSREANPSIRRPDRGWEPIVGPVSLDRSRGGRVHPPSEDPNP